MSEGLWASGFFGSIYVIPAIIKEGASSGCMQKHALGQYRMHTWQMFVLEVTHHLRSRCFLLLRPLQNCRYIGGCDVSSANSEMLDNRCFLRFNNHFASKMLFSFYPRYATNNRLEEPKSVNHVIMLYLIHGRTASHPFCSTCFPLFLH